MKPNNQQKIAKSKGITSSFKSVEKQGSSLVMQTPSSPLLNIHIIKNHYFKQGANNLTYQVSWFIDSIFQGEREFDDIKERERFIKEVEKK